MPTDQYDILAQQAGAIGGIDYDALAGKAGGSEALQGGGGSPPGPHALGVGGAGKLPWAVGVMADSVPDPGEVGRPLDRNSIESGSKLQQAAFDTMLTLLGAKQAASGIRDWSGPPNPTRTARTAGLLNSIPGIGKALNTARVATTNPGAIDANTGEIMPAGKAGAATPMPTNTNALILRAQGVNVPGMENVTPAQAARAIEQLRPPKPTKSAPQGPPTGAAPYGTSGWTVQQNPAAPPVASIATPSNLPGAGTITPAIQPPAPIATPSNLPGVMGAPTGVRGAAPLSETTVNTLTGAGPKPAPKTVTPKPETTTDVNSALEHSLAQQYNFKINGGNLTKTGALAEMKARGLDAESVGRIAKLLVDRH